MTQSDTKAPTASEIAITGIGCRFPGGSDTPEKFWEMMCRGEDTVREIPPDRWSIDSYYHPDPGTPGRSYSKWGAFLDDIRSFDAEAFGISPREAVAIDPQHRLLLECAHEAIEDSGTPFEKLRQSDCGVYVGICYSDYAQIQTGGSSLRQIGQYTGTGSVLSLASNRISYVFDLRGPSLSVDTACSSSLIALNEACNSLRRGEISHALVGGVNAIISPQLYVIFCRLHMLSPVGRCQSFAAEADGFVRGEGAGMIMLKPLAKALADGDRVHAVIRATGANEDGRTNGITIPRLEAQAALLRETYADAGIRPEEVDYIEAHGTGTPVGDPIEANAIGSVLGAGRPDGRPLFMGSVKSNIGHLEGGAGIAGLIKAVLVLQNRTVPPNLHFKNPSQYIDFDELGLRVPTAATPLEPMRPGGALIAGVNSFGFGGANAHAVISSAPSAAAEPSPVAVNENGARPSSPQPLSRARHFLPLSVRTEEALAGRAASIASFLRGLPEKASLDDVCSTAAHYRSHFDHRLLVSGFNADEVAGALEAFVDDEPAQNLVSGRAPSGDRPLLAFVCSGQGPQWWGMGRELLAQEPVFRREIEACDAIVRSLGDWSLVEEMSRDEASSRMGDPAIAQPAIFALQAGVAAVFRNRGIEPDLVVGHSVGEIAAAYIAGAIPLEDAVRVIWWRGQTIGAAPKTGRMLAVGLPADEVRKRIARLGDKVGIAAFNAPGSVTLSGEADALGSLAAELDHENIFNRFLRVEYAFHSSDMDGVRDPLLRALSDLPPSAEPRFPLVSTVTGAKVAAGELDAGYWWRNVREPVRFAGAMEGLFERGAGAVLELAPHPVLSGSVRECARAHLAGDGDGDGRPLAVTATLRRGEPEVDSLLRSLGELYVSGVQPEWDTLTGGAGLGRRRVSLPTYAWQRRTYWNDAAQAQSPWSENARHPLLGRGDPTGEEGWRAYLDFSVLPWLEHHGTRGRSLFPATGHLEIGLAVAAELHGSEGGAVLEEMSFEKALFLSSEGAAAELRTVCDRSSGRIRVLSRPGGSREPWVLYAQGIVSSEKPLLPGNGSRPPTLDIDAVRARCPDRIDGAQVYDEYHQAGFDYGESFQAIAERWLGNGEALCRVNAGWEAHEEAPGYAFHPPAADATLQLFGGTMPLSFHLARRGVFVPVRVGRLRFHHAPRGELWIHSTARHVTDRSIDGDIRVYDSSGSLVVEFLDVTSREAFRSNESVDDWFFSIRWDRVPLDVGRAERRRLVAMSIPAPSARLSLGAAGSPEGGDPVGALHRSLIDADEAGADARITAFLGKHPARVSEIMLLRENDRGGDHLRFLWNHVLTDSPLARHANSALAGTLANLFENARPGEPLSVLELGDHLGGPTEEILASCRAGLDRYGFACTTGVEPTGNDRAFRRDSRVTMVDAKADSAIASFAPDIVCLTDLRNPAPWDPAGLESLRTSLEPNCLLIALAFQGGGDEPEPSSSWIETLGLHRLSDSKERLNAAGFDVLPDETVNGAREISMIAALVPDPEARSEPSQSADPPEPAEPSRPGLEGDWLLLADQGGVAASIASRLKDRGGTCRLVGAEEDLAEMLTGAAEATPPLRGIIHCLALDATPCAETTAGSLLADEQAICHRTLTLIQELQRLELEDPPQLVIVSAGAQDVGRPGRGREQIALTQSPLLGMGLVIGSELPNLRCRLIDLPFEPAQPDIEVLLDEIAAGSSEEEIAIRDGQRYLPTITPSPLERMPRTEGGVPEGAALRLPVPPSGQFEHLCFEESQMPEPAPDEVVIEIHAAALNFRDVLKVLGLYPTDNDDCFRLGDECSGVVTAVGESVTHLEPGDEVIAVGVGGMLASHARTKAAVTIKKPARLTHEAAATLPNVFLAAYHAIHHVAQLQEGETILIHAAAGGVGLAAMQLARERGARIFATASAAKRELVRSMGAEAVFDSRSLDFAEQVRRLTDGHGVDVVINSLAGEALRKSFAVMAPYGRFVEIGKMDIYQNQGLPMRPFAANVSFHAIDIARVMTERADLAEDMFVNLEKRMHSGALQPLPLRSFPAARIGEAFRHMSQARHVGKLVVSMRDGNPPSHLPAPDGLRLREDRSYLITGGYTGLGLAVAGCFIEHGARHIILLGRSGVKSDYGREAIDKMRAGGASVFEARGDVADLEQLRAVLRDASGEHGMPPLAGVFHSAMVLDDNILIGLDPERFHRVMLPKVAGGWNLHTLTKDIDLDFFVLCSSFAAMIGNPGQGNYAAANLFLDTLASYRRSLDLPGTAVAWGVLGGFGVVHEDEKLRELYDRRGITPLEPRNILDVLRLVNARDVTRPGAIRVRWGQLAAALFHYQDRIRGKLRELADAEGFDWSAAAQPAGLLREEVRSLEPEEGLERVTASLRGRLAKILGVSPERLDAETPLNMVGLDSLMTVELQTQLERELEVTLSEGDLAENPNLSKLSQKIYARLAADADAKGT